MPSTLGCFQEINTLHYRYPFTAWQIPEKDHSSSRHVRSKRQSRVCGLGACLTKIDPSESLLLVGWHLELQLLPAAPLTWPPASRTEGKILFCVHNQPSLWLCCTLHWSALVEGYYGESYKHYCLSPCLLREASIFPILGQVAHPTKAGTGLLFQLCFGPAWEPHWTIASFGFTPKCNPLTVLQVWSHKP